MKTILTPATAESIRQAAEIIREGGVVGFPTETVYGLGGNALSGEAAKRIFAAKGRPGDNPLIAHVCSYEMAEELAHWNDMARLLAEKYWPGPLTLVLPKKNIVPDEVTAGLPSVALRWPVHPVAAALIARSGRPVAAPSANISGRPSPTTAAHVLEDMEGKIPLILDGGSCDIGLESTVVDVRGEYPLLLRPGRITKEELAELCGDCLLPKAGDAKRPAAPGMKYRHYAPKGQLYLAADGEEALLIAKRLEKIPLFLVSRETAKELEDAGIPQKRIIGLFSQNDIQSYGKSIFAALRDADTAGESVMIAQSVGEQGFGRAIMNRLKKAAAK